jgi:two-component system, chemotaxis family, CheB/CheR fusion protein
VVSLEQELVSTKEHLQTTIEELETSNEELKSTNEELQSVNEELQSTNEELETSKEELQSTNEELVTVNTELQNKVDELSEANNDINNLLASTDIGTIFLDTELNIKRYTPAMTKIFNLIPTDVGRSIGDITAKIEYGGITRDAGQVLATLTKIEEEIQTGDGAWYSMNISPYRTLENVIDGVVITFVDITRIKVGESSIRRLATVVMDSNDAITVYDLKGNISAWNKGAKKMYGYSEAEALKMNIRDIVPDDKKAETLDFIRQLREEKEVSSLNTQRKTKDGRVLDVWLTVTKLVDDEGKTIAVATTERDVTGWKKDE